MKNEITTSRLNLICARLGWCSAKADIRAQVKHNLSANESTGRGSSAKRRARKIEDCAVATVGCAGYTKNQWAAILYANS